MLERGWDRWPASFGLPAPEEAEALTVPGDEGPASVLQGGKSQRGDSIRLE
jgi:hypothetical protein